MPKEVLNPLRTVAIGKRRADHIWFRKGEFWKCCLCGAVTKDLPPSPTPKEWVELRYELPLEQWERDQAPFEAVLVPGLPIPPSVR